MWLERYMTAPERLQALNDSRTAEKRQAYALENNTADIERKNAEFRERAPRREWEKYKECAQRCLDALGLTPDTLESYRGNPLDPEILKPIADAGIPVLHLLAEADEVVPGADNTDALLPVFASLFDFRNTLPALLSTESETGVKTDKTARIHAFIQNIDNSLTQYLCFALGLVLSVITSTGGLPQEYALFSLIPIAFYSGKRGKLNLKYFFYLFYPLHLVAIEGVYLLLYFL
jgi:hypothetical protein